MGNPGRHVREAFGRDSSEIGRARRFVGAALGDWGFEAERGALELAVSELVSNAVRHGRGTISVRLDADRECIQLAVADEGGGRPTLRTPQTSGDAMGGWGLRFVDELADDWGTVVLPGQTVVWLVKAHAAPGRGYRRRYRRPGGGPA